MASRLEVLGVASYTEAWIETALSASSVTSMIVASYTEAWIETSVYLTM